jgi:hypothetical protein
MKQRPKMESRKDALPHFKDSKRRDLAAVASRDQRAEPHQKRKEAEKLGAEK